MILALFALAAAMMIGGIAAVIQGFPFVRLESGLAMVIAGATTASAGAVLLGLGVVATGLKRMERALAAVRSAPAEPAGILPAAPPFDLAASRPRPTLGGAPAAAGTAALAGAAALPGTAALAADGALDDLRPGRPLSEPALQPDPAAEPELPLPEPAGQPGDGAVPEDDLFAEPEPEPAPVAAPAPTPAPPPFEVQLEPEPAPEPAPEPVRTAAPEAPKLEVVGTYASGGNTYVMFSNGSIEAETPRGRFTFNSLDELKAFVEAGGESGTRGAA
ncbi:hypothetical protein [Methylobacterium sp. A54F]